MVVGETHHLGNPHILENDLIQKSGWRFSMGTRQPAFGCFFLNHTRDRKLQVEHRLHRLTFSRSKRWPFNKDIITYSISRIPKIFPNSFLLKSDTVDGRNPAPVEVGSLIPLFTVFYVSHVVSRISSINRRNSHMNHWKLPNDSDRFKDSSISGPQKKRLHRRRCKRKRILEAVRIQTDMSHEKNPYYFPLYWLVNRDPYNGLLSSLYS